jgi:hypothetical protein
MKGGVHLVLGATLRLYLPLLTLWALGLLAAWPASSGVGFVAGAALGLAASLQVLVFGAEAARTAFPPALARLILSLGVAIAAAAAGLPGWSASAKAGETGLLLATLGATQLILLVLCGRAPTLRDEDW